MKLTTNISEALIEIINENIAPIDGLEVGPWLSPREVFNYREIFPQYPFYFHGGNIIDGVGIIPGTINKIGKYLQVTNSPWISLHITFLFPGIRRLFIRNNWRIPNINIIDAVNLFITKVKRTTSMLGVVPLLENLDPIKGYANVEIQPSIINRILQETNGRLLLDIGHARLSAERLEMTPEEYIAKLPMEKVDQIHVSGPRERNGVLFDAHEPLQGIDYRLLNFVLTQTKAKVITLEYIRNKELLLDQLLRIREIII
jgi:hypothetical protein